MAHDPSRTRHHRRAISLARGAAGPPLGEARPARPFSLGLAAALLALCAWQGAAPRYTGAFELVAPNLLVAPAITAAPIEVVLWVRDTVSADDEAWVTGEIAAGLALWEDVETSGLRFVTRVVRGATEPAVAPTALLVVVANRIDLTTGGASQPNGFPGRWRGAVADFRVLCGTPCERFRYVAAHEIGHALGLLHSTASTRHFDAGTPVMDFAPDAAGLSPDDVAAISVAYPDPARPLATVTGTLAGRCVDATTARPVSGVNVVAVDRATGAPAVARLSGAAGDAGTFAVVGLPPGTYDLHFLDGASFGGSFFGLPARAVQTDNFAPFVLGPFVVTADGQEDLGDVPVAIAPIRIDAARALLPDATGGAAYDVAIDLHGGVRPLAIAGAADLPAGLGTSLIERPEISNETPGRAALRLRGAPRDLGAFAPAITLADGHGSAAALDLALRVTDTLANPLCTDGARITAAALTLTGLRTPPGDEALTLTGRIVLSPEAAAALDPAASGLQVSVDDIGAGGTPLFELSTATGAAIDGSPIPPAGAACGARDGWRVGARAERYRNRSTALDAPACTPGSANGLTTVELRHDRRHPGEIRLKLKTRRSTLAAAPTGPLRVTLVFGAAPDAGATGLCASTHAFSALRCTASSNGARLRCE